MCLLTQINWRAKSLPHPDAWYFPAPLTSLTKIQNQSQILNNALRCLHLPTFSHAHWHLHIFDSLWKSTVKFYFEITTDWLILHLGLFPKVFSLLLQDCVATVVSKPRFPPCNLVILLFFILDSCLSYSRNCYHPMHSPALPLPLFSLYAL